MFFAPAFVAGCAGVLLGQAWGYVLFGVTGACSLYINIILWFTEKAYVYPTRGPLRHFTYYWGFFVYWGALALAYSVLHRRHSLVNDHLSRKLPVNLKGPG